MGNTTSTIIVAILASNALFAFIQFLITRHDNKKRESADKKFDAVTKELVYLKKDVLRTQLLLLVLIKPEEDQEILTIAEHYFKDLHGNWYMTSIFNKWLESEDVAKPDWFKEQ